MRVLFSFAGGIGHSEPMVPIADALRTAGHTVAFAGNAASLPTLAAKGFHTVVAAGTPGDPRPARTPLLEPDQRHEEQVIRSHYADAVPRARAARYREIYHSWRPDLVVRDEADLGSALLTERLGLPHAVVLVLAAGGFIRPEVVADPLDALRAELGLAPDPTLAALWRGLVLSPFAPSLRDPAFPLPPATHWFRPPEPARTAGPLPAWWDRLGDRPVVYVTLGTVFPLESGDLFARLLAGLAALPVEVVATVGPDVDPVELGPQPAHVHVERWLPQALLLPRARLVVSHGGSGTVAAAAAHGVPQVVLAMGADQLLNAARVTALSLGRALHPVTVTPAQLSDAAAAVLADPSVRAAADRLRAEYATLPAPADAVPLLEALT